MMEEWRNGTQIGWLLVVGVSVWIYDDEYTIFSKS